MLLHHAQDHERCPTRPSTSGAFAGARLSDVLQLSRSAFFDDMLCLTVLVTGGLSSPVAAQQLYGLPGM